MSFLFQEFNCFGHLLNLSHTSKEKQRLAIFLFITTKSITFVMIVVLLIIDVISSMVLHETLHLYLFRKIIKKVKGTLVIENFKIFILIDLMKNRQITKKQAFVICLLPPIICTVVGFLILGIISYGLKFFTLTKIIYIFISISWLVNILSIFPFSPDFKTWKMYCNNIDKIVE